jgi:hypothetical protein
MRKTLLIAAAALAASVISSQAQVYSQNIVGYVNITIPAGFSGLANPLENNGDNATNFFDTTSGAQDGNIVLSWTGVKYAQVQVDSTSATGFSDPVSNASKPAPIMKPGVGFLFNNQNGSLPITFTGTVAAGGPGASTNVVGLTTNVLSSSPTLSLNSSILPISGGISSVLGLANPGGNYDGCIVLIPNIVGGAIHGYTSVQFDSTSGTGFSDPVSNASRPEPTINVGQSFLFNNQSGAPISWQQSL